ncbi:hypothetical protein [Streptomyces sp. MP131-18]|uniref:hypothetical protein n=1 Tax=Streptomyces sp. MP131-18 TaxID=1857892 RepID=UPI00097C122C|nr:hypothetical protein [Streptomyces sp. MP131-18]ONK13249.1 hypothetical protein STBA_40120 [Streptomyces sp. MP131-18]
MSEHLGPVAFPGRQYTRPPVPRQPPCHFQNWPFDPDGFHEQSSPIGSAADGPDLSGKPLEYARYMAYGFDVPNRRLWVEVDCYMTPSTGGIDGYVARPPERRMHGRIPYRFFVDLAHLRSATVHHRTGTAPSSLHTDRCDHPLVRNGELLADHAGHRQCYELYVCQHRAGDLHRIAREHGDECTYWQLRPGFCDDRQQLAIDTAQQSEHAYLQRASDQRVVFRHRADTR